MLWDCKILRSAHFKNILIFDFFFNENQSSDTKKQACVAVTIYQIFIRDVLGHPVFYGFPQSILANSGMVPRLINIVSDMMTENMPSGQDVT
jgi:hypothetical protein